MNLSNTLLSKNWLVRIFCWYLLLGALNNIVIEPLTKLSHRVTGITDDLPVPYDYRGSWKSLGSEEVVAVKISWEKLSFSYKDTVELDRSYSLNCEKPSIGYDYSQTIYKYLYPFWFKIIDPWLFFLIPDTLFGTQYLSWSCKFVGEQDSTVKIRVYETIPGVTGETINVRSPYSYDSLYKTK